MSSKFDPMEMHHRVSWLIPVDVDIVDFMGECRDGDALVTPKVISHNIDYNRSYVGAQLRQTLVPYGLAELHGNGLYTLTERGKRFARREIEPEELEAIEPDDQ